MLVVDQRSLGSVNFLYAPDNVALGFFLAGELEQFLQIQVSLAKLLAGFDFLAGLHPQRDLGSDFIFQNFSFSFFILGLGLYAYYLFRSNFQNFSFNLGNLRFSSGNSCFKNFLDPGQAGSNVSAAGYSSRMEGSHGQLSARLSDCLSRDNSHRFSQFYQFIGSQIPTVALLTKTPGCPAGQRAAHPYLFDIGGNDFFRHLPVNDFSLFANLGDVIHTNSA